MLDDHPVMFANKKSKSLFGFNFMGSTDEGLLKKLNKLRFTRVDMQEAEFD